MAIPDCCDGCVKWEKFGKNCWVFWENKKECTMHIKDWSDQIIF